LESKKIDISEELVNRSPDVEKLKYCYECSTCTASCPSVWIFTRRYNPKILLQKISLGLEDVLNEVGLWMCTRCYRCYQKCPQGLDLPEIFLATKDFAIEGNYLPNAEGTLKEALKLVKEEISLAAIYGWLCLRPSEEESARKIEKLATRALKSFVVDYTKEKISPVSEIRGEKIAIIGSGPAGLSAAYKLIKMGYPVTVFESLPEAGGMLRVGIPEYRLPKSVLDIEIQRMKKIGIEIKTDTKIGRDLMVDNLFQEGYKAIFIAIGAHKSTELHIEGENLEGVVDALDLLKEFNTGKKVSLGERVVIIGGGNVAVDVARTALRLGSKDINIFYRRSKVEMPANPSGVKEAEREGIKFHFLIAPKKILGEDGRVVALESVRMRLGELDETGRRRPIPMEGSEFTVQLDTIILAIGESPDLFSMPKEIEVAKDNTIKANPLTLETSMPGVFAGGDVVSGPATVMGAIAAGIKVASSIDSYLRREISANT